MPFGRAAVTAPPHQEVRRFSQRRAVFRALQVPRGQINTYEHCVSVCAKPLGLTLSEGGVNGNEELKCEAATHGVLEVNLNHGNVRFVTNPSLNGFNQSQSDAGRLRRPYREVPSCR